MPEDKFLNKVYVLDMNGQGWSWWKEEVGNVTAVGTYIPSVIRTIDDLTAEYGTIDGMTGVQIDDLSGRLESNFPLLIEGNNVGTSYYEDEDAYNDGSTLIDSYIVTGDEIFQDKTGKPFTSDRVMGLRFEAKGLQSSGDRLYFYYSLDEGSTWTAITAGLKLADFSVWTTYLGLTDGWAFYEAHADVMTRKVRFKLGNAIVSSTFMVRKFSPIFEDGDYE